MLVATSEFLLSINCFTGIFSLSLSLFLNNFLDVFIEFITLLLQFYVFGDLATGHVGSEFWTRDQTPAACIGKRGLNHWTAREVPGSYF